MEHVTKIWSLFWDAVWILVPIYFLVGTPDFVKDYIMKFKREFRGFTLIELMIVIAIIGILGAIIVPGIRSGVSETPPAIKASKTEAPFKEFVDKDCVEKYGEFACNYEKAE